MDENRYKQLTKAINKTHEGKPRTWSEIRAEINKSVADDDVICFIEWDMGEPIEILELNAGIAIAKRKR